METIFISIASYRDEETPKTIISAFSQASNPNRVFLGICQQNKSGDVDCINNKIITSELNPIFLKQIRVLRIDYTEAKGPTWARYLCSLLYRGEQYFMQIDSHIQFAKDWDKICIDSINQIKNENLSQKPVLSYYPKHYDKGKGVIDNDPDNVPRICKSFINDRNMVSYPGAELLQKASRPTKSSAVAAGTFFCEGSFLKDVPFDPELPNLFVGEEILFAARLWTSGYDIFNFNKNVTYHYYTREKDPKFWTDKKNYTDNDAFQKVKYLLNLENIKKQDLALHLQENVDSYGLGKERTIADFWKFSGIDWNKKTVDKDFCRNQDGTIIEKFTLTNTTKKINKKYFFIIIFGFILLIFYKSFYKIIKKYKLKM